jgi:hypothetical protein
MKNAVDDFEHQSEYFFNQADAVYEDYNWQKRCDDILNDAIKRLGVSMFKPLS